MAVSTAIVCLATFLALTFVMVPVTIYYVPDLPNRISSRIEKIPFLDVVYSTWSTDDYAQQQNLLEYAWESIYPEFSHWFPMGFGDFNTRKGTSIAARNQPENAGFFKIPTLNTTTALAIYYPKENQWFSAGICLLLVYVIACIGCAIAMNFLKTKNPQILIVTTNPTAILSPTEDVRTDSEHSAPRDYFEALPTQEPSTSAAGEPDRIEISNTSSEETTAETVSPVVAEMEALGVADADTSAELKVLHKIGRGGFACVYKAEMQMCGDVEARHIALKQMSKRFMLARDQVKYASTAVLDFDNCEQVLKELDMLKAVRNGPFVNKILLAFQTREHVWFGLEYCGGQSLSALVNSGKLFEENAIQFYARELICGISFIHSKGIVHRDLSLNNIMLTIEGHICIIDFGLADNDVRDDTELQDVVGTPEFIAPEVYAEKPCNKAWEVR